MKLHKGWHLINKTDPDWAVTVTEAEYNSLRHAPFVRKLEAGTNNWYKTRAFILR